MKTRLSYLKIIYNPEKEPNTSNFLSFSGLNSQQNKPFGVYNKLMILRGLHGNSLDMDKTADASYCKFNPICAVYHNKGKCSKDYLDCQVFRFYRKWGR